MSEPYPRHVFLIRRVGQRATLSARPRGSLHGATIHQAGRTSCGASNTHPRSMVRPRIAVNPSQAYVYQQRLSIRAGWVDPRQPPRMKSRNPKQVFWVGRLSDALRAGYKSKYAVGPTGENVLVHPRRLHGLRKSTLIILLTWHPVRHSS